MAEENKETLIPMEKYLVAGLHIGTLFKTGDMRRFVFKTRKDGLKVFDIETIDSRIRTVAKFIAGLPSEKIAVVSRKLYGRTAVKKFAELVGCKAFTGRFIPGTFTNPRKKGFVEPKIVIITDPEADAQAVEEATGVNAIIVALASSNNSLKNIDFIVPANNSGRKSLATAYWLLAREILKEKGVLKKDDDFEKELEAFEYKLKEGAEETEEDIIRQAMRERQQRGRWRFGRGGGRGRPQRPGQGFQRTRRNSERN